MPAAPFRETLSLAAMSSEQWESLCDGCALCCLQKLEDEDDNEIYYTDVACELLDTGTGASSCRCKHYAGREQYVEECMRLTPDNLTETLRWLPDTCAYKLLAQQKPLPSWHPLRTGDPQSVHTAGMSARGRCVASSTIDPDNLDERVVYWVSGFGE
jgi:hypothetical protein